MACGAGVECLSGHCIEGFCCGSAACGACNSCAVPGKQGTCSPVADGTACGAGMCDGKDRLQPAVDLLDRHVHAGTRIDCAPWGCNAAAGCNTSCATDADCAKKHTCTRGRRRQRLHLIARTLSCGPTSSGPQA